MNLNRSELRVACVSDIHLGHPRTPTVHILNNLRREFPDNAETAQLDIIWLAGDVLDRLLTVPNEDVPEIHLWIASFLRMCKKHDIMVRVLEGTPSHDWKQSELFVAINEAAEIGADLKYVKDLSIEYIQSLDIQVLYVPDEWESTTEKTLHQVHELLHAKGLDKVDFAIMHGQFEYQLPPFVKAQKHDSASYLAVVRHLIFIGHVHVHSRHDRIIAQGSFDRLSHGEEGPKGHVRAVIKQDGTYTVTFVENEGAMQYLTIDCNHMSLDETLLEVDAKASRLPPGSFVRVEANHDNPIFSNMEMLVRNHPLLIWSKKANETEKDDIEMVEDETEYVPITLTKDNLEGLLLERLVNTGASGEVVNAGRDILREVM